MGAGLNGTIFDDLDGPPNPVFNVTAFLKSNISEIVRLGYKVTIKH